MTIWAWNTLHHLEVGRFGVDFARVQFAMAGWRTYEPYVDNHAVDFLAVHPDGRQWKVQVKAVRKRNYAFLRKQDVDDFDHTVLALVLLDEGEPPKVFAIPLQAWRSPNAALADRDYPGLKSAPEYGVQPSPTNEHLLEAYAVPRSLA